MSEVPQHCMARVLTYKAPLSPKARPKFDCRRPCVSFQYRIYLGSRRRVLQMHSPVTRHASVQARDLRTQPHASHPNESIYTSICHPPDTTFATTRCPPRRRALQHGAGPLSRHMHLSLGQPPAVQWRAS